MITRRLDSRCLEASVSFFLIRKVVSFFLNEIQDCTKAEPAILTRLSSVLISRVKNFRTWRALKEICQYSFTRYQKMSFTGDSLTNGK